MGLNDKKMLKKITKYSKSKTGLNFQIQINLQN